MKREGYVFTGETKTTVWREPNAQCRLYSRVLLEPVGEICARRRGASIAAATAASSARVRPTGMEAGGHAINPLPLGEVER